MTIIIDNGHGVDTLGKCSPDRRFREYRFNREIARAVVEHLQLRGFDAVLLVPEEEDIPLRERVRRANQITCRLGHPVQETIVVSIHVNAAGNGSKWMSATGWSAYTYYGHSDSDRLATCLYEAAKKHLPGHKLRTDYSDGDPDIEAPFYILKDTYAAAVLTENGFMDNELSLSFLESDAGKKAIVALHVEGIINYFLGLKV
jgi:N-acetylmuramoyl-L-alanine amidase